jgi:predicted ATPase
MDTLKRAAEQAKAGHGQVVAVMAEPGVGKSRLLDEFKTASQSGWMVLEASSISHGKASAYLPVIDLLYSYFEIKVEDDARQRRKKVNHKILTLDRSLEDTLPYLFRLIGIVEGPDPLAQMDAQTRRRRTLETIKRLLLRESLNQPLTRIWTGSMVRRRRCSTCWPTLSPRQESCCWSTIVLSTITSGVARPTTPSSGSIRS